MFTFLHLLFAIKFVAVLFFVHDTDNQRAAAAAVAASISPTPQQIYASVASSAANQYHQHQYHHHHRTTASPRLKRSRTNNKSPTSSVTSSSPLNANDDNGAGVKSSKRWKHDSAAATMTSSRASAKPSLPTILSDPILASKSLLASRLSSGGQQKNDLGRKTSSDPHLNSTRFVSYFSSYSSSSSFSSSSSSFSFSSSCSSFCRRVLDLDLFFL